MINFCWFIPILAILVLIIFAIIKACKPHKVAESTESTTPTDENSLGRLEKVKSTFSAFKATGNFLKSLIIFITIMICAGWLIVTAYVGLMEAVYPVSPWTPVGRMTYTPNIRGWTSRSVNIPPGEGVCRIKCIHGYNQYYSTIGKTLYVPPSGNSIATDVMKLVEGYEKLSQLIKVDGKVSAALSYEFECNDNIKALLAPNLIAHDISKNTGEAVFIIEKRQI